MINEVKSRFLFLKYWRREWWDRGKGREREEKSNDNMVKRGKEKKVEKEKEKIICSRRGRLLQRQREPGEHNLAWNVGKYISQEGRWGPQVLGHHIARQHFCAPTLLQVEFYSVFPNLPHRVLLACAKVQLLGLLLSRVFEGLLWSSIPGLCFCWTSLARISSLLRVCITPCETL